MTLVGTEVTYPGGATRSVSDVVHVTPAGGGRSAVVVASTAFHPVDTAWPDQPSDRGILTRSDGTQVPIIEAVVGATEGGELFLGRDVPVRTGTDGWTFVVAHLVEGEPPTVGETVTVDADPTLRAQLSRGHTACHLASLALDAALADAWRKDTPVDALGAPAFDALAIQESRILPDGSRDVYRIGKSLRRKGFDPEAFDDLDALAARVTATLSAWIATGGRVRIEADGPALADRRTWVCELAEAVVRIPCGGTHATDVAELETASVSFARTPVDGGVEIVMTTVVTPR